MENGNVTESKERKTKKELCKSLKISPKTMDLMKEFTDCLKRLKETLCDEPELYELIDKHCNISSSKSRLSRNDIKMMACLEKTELIEMLRVIKEHPNNVRYICNNHMPMKDVKVTIEVPSYVNEFLKDEAEESGLSRNVYLRKLLIGFFRKYADNE